MHPALLLAVALVALVFLRRNDRIRDINDTVGSLVWPNASGATSNETAMGQSPDPTGMLIPGNISYDPTSGEFLT